MKAALWMWALFALTGCDGSGVIHIGDTDSDTDTTPAGVDEDGDGYGVNEDCDDADAAIHPDAFEACDGIDNDCDGEADPRGSCRCVTSVYDAHVYQFCTELNDWVGAEQSCEATGTHLVVVESEGENSFISAGAVREMPYLDEWWIGLSDRQQEGEWAWVEEPEGAFESWAWGEPNDFGDGEDCAELFAHGGVWNDNHCETALSYICESF